MLSYVSILDTRRADMFHIRPALTDDLEFMVRIDLKSEGTTTTNANKTPKELEEHRNTVASFLQNSKKGAFICEDQSSRKQIGLLMYRIRNRDFVPDYSILQKIERGVFPYNGQLMEVYQLWVDKDFRKKGIASKLKLRLEDEAKNRDIQLVYSYTEATNIPVLKMNKKLNYKEVWRGPIWDGIVRVAFVKHLFQ
jgi:ribosomal protein S18 acetylase RimI-like enzyme